MLLALFLTATPFAAPPEPLLSQIRGAIWSDLELNAMIGSGNDMAWLWYNAAGLGAAEGPTLHIVDLVCHGNARLQRCRFGLLRDGGVRTLDGQRIPDRLRCDTYFRFVRGADGGWTIPHRPPPPTGGHTITTLHCSWVLARRMRAPTEWRNDS